MATSEPSKGGSEEHCLKTQIARLEREQARLTDRVDLLHRICETHVFAGPIPQVGAPFEALVAKGPKAALSLVWCRLRLQLQQRSLILKPLGCSFLMSLKRLTSQLQCTRCSGSGWPLPPELSVVQTMLGGLSAFKVGLPGQVCRLLLLHVRVLLRTACG